MAKSKNTKSTNKYIVPENEQREFDLLVQRANRRVLSNLKQIEKNNITSENTVRSLMGDYADSKEWLTKKTPFSRAKKFNSEKDYRQYVRHISQWGAEGDDFTRSEDAIKERYYKSIIQALTTTAIDNGNGVLTKTGRLPGNLAKKIRELSLEQLTNFFDHSDPTESIESQGWGSENYIGVDREEFVDITKSHIDALKELFPDTNQTTTTKTKKKKKAKKTAKKRKKRKAK